MNEFCAYHRDGDGECNAITLKYYADRHGLDTHQRFDLAYFFSVVYCCESGIVLFNNRGAIRRNPIEAAAFLKPEMIFQSDRKYMKMRDCFARSLQFWAERLQIDAVKKYVADPVLDLQSALKTVESWYMFGRFSAYLFLETYATLNDLGVTDISIDWEHGDTATSGLLNLFCDDEYANYFDREGVLKVPVDKMDARLRKVANLVKISGGDANTTKLETSLCAYRKFYKGSRYNGYYLDRMLEELNYYGSIPKHMELTKELFKIRETAFRDELLGEKHGWTGIRKENKKLYMEYGII